MKIERKSDSVRLSLVNLNCGECFMFPDTGSLCMKITQFDKKFNFVYLDTGNADYCDPETLVILCSDAVINLK